MFRNVSLLQALPCTLGTTGDTTGEVSAFFLVGKTDKRLTSTQLSSGGLGTWTVYRGENACTAEFLSLCSLTVDAGEQLPCASAAFLPGELCPETVSHSKNPCFLELLLSHVLLQQGHRKK